MSLNIQRVVKVFEYLLMGGEIETNNQHGPLCYKLIRKNEQMEESEGKVYIAMETAIFAKYPTWGDGGIPDRTNTRLMSYGSEIEDIISFAESLTEDQYQTLCADMSLTKMKRENR
jgi:hypothetical protein